MAAPLLKKLTLTDYLEAVNKEERLELYDGAFEKKALPSAEHSNAQTWIVTLISTLFGRKTGGGPGGWWIKTDISVFYPKHEAVFSHDVAGWRRDRVPENLKGFPVKIAPDWVCEVCLSTHKKDERAIPLTLQAHGVPWYWLVDVEREMITVFQLQESSGKYLVNQKLFRCDGYANMEPFASEKLSLELIFGGEEKE
jgi:Uma2 family endonuclease